MLPERWGNYYEAGDMTKCFETIEEVVSLAKEVFQLRFDEEWEFYVESPYSRWNGVLNINKNFKNNV